MFEQPGKCTLGSFDQSETNTIYFYTLGLETILIINEKTFHEQNLTMNITAKHNMSFNISI